MDLYINLNNQGETRFKKKTLIIFMIITFSLALVTGIVLLLGLEESKSTFLVVYMIYFLLISLSLYMQLKGKHIFDFFGKSYIKMNNQDIEFKIRLFDKNIVSINWSDIEDIEIKLFEVRIKTQKGWTSISLDKLSDDNLKLVKGRLQDFKSHLMEKKPLSA